MLFETSDQKQGSKSQSPPAQPANVAGLANKAIRSPSSIGSTTRANSHVNANSSAKQVNRSGVAGKTSGAQNTTTSMSANKASTPPRQIKSPKGYTTTTTQQAPVTGWPSHRQSMQKAKLSKPASTAPAQKGFTGTTAKNQQKAQLKGWPSRQQSLSKAQLSKATSMVPIQKGSGKTSAVNQPKMQVKGWPSRQQSLKSQTTSRLPYSARITPAQGSVKGGSLPQASQKPQRPATSNITSTITRKNYQSFVKPKGMQQTVTGGQYLGRGAQRPQTITTAPIQKRQMTGRWYSGGITPQRIKSNRYYTTNRNYITNTGTPYHNEPAYATAQGAPSVQTSVIGWPSNRFYSSPDSTSQPCDCSQCNNATQPGNNTTQFTSTQTSVRQSNASVQPTTTVAPKTHVCKTCGLKTKGCTTLSGFAINTALLTPNHKQQLRQLASSILQKNSNAVIATGYTNSSKTEQLVENLGERRALAVVSELKRQLSKLKPNAHKSIFWKTLSKAVTQQDSISASGNRRVEICIRQLR